MLLSIELQEELKVPATQASGTQAPTTTQSAQVNLARKFLPSLINKLGVNFENKRPGLSRA